MYSVRPLVFLAQARVFEQLRPWNSSESGVMLRAMLLLYVMYTRTSLGIVLRLRALTYGPLAQQVELVGVNHAFRVFVSHSVLHVSCSVLSCVLGVLCSLSSPKGVFRVIEACLPSSSSISLF